MRKLVLPFLLILTIAVIATTPPFMVIATNSPKPVIAVDLAHGENDKALSYMMGNMTDFEFKVLSEPITGDALEDVTILIIGQPMTVFTPEEVMAIQNWLAEGEKVLWVASDSDYGSGPQSQQAANAILEAIGSSLRIDFSAVYDDVVNCGRFYRVVGLVQPDEDTPLRDKIVMDFQHEGKVLYHGPAPLAWVDEEGNWHNLTKTKPENVYRIVWTSENGYIGDNNPPPTMAYLDELTGHILARYVMLAVEHDRENNNLIIVSGESPYGDYQPTWTSEYYGVELDGPQFVMNLIRWAYLMATVPPVTVTETVVETEYVTTTITETKVQTVTETKTLTETTTKILTETKVETRVTTEIATTTVEKTVTETKTQTATVTATETVTETVGITGTTLAIVIILIIIFAAIGYFLGKRT